MGLTELWTVFVQGGSHKLVLINQGFLFFIFYILLLFGFFLCFIFYNHNKWWKIICFNIKSSYLQFPPFQTPLQICSDSSSTISSFSMNSTKVDGILHPILGSLGQFWLTKINLSKFSDCNRHILKLVKIPTREKMFLVSIWELKTLKICFAKMLATWNLDSCFSHHWRRFFISFTSTWNLLKSNNPLVTISFVVLALLLVVWKIFSPQSWSTSCFVELEATFPIGCKWLYDLTNMGYNVLLSYSSTFLVFYQHMKKQDEDSWT